MELQTQVAKVWESYSDNRHIPSFIKERRYGLYVDIEQKDILILGLNPLFHSRSVLKPTKYNMFYHIGDESKMSSYQREINKLLVDNVIGINLLKHTSYLDLFYFRESVQDSSIDQLLDVLDGRMFLIDQLEITQTVLEEVIKPKVIIMSSEHVALFMGLYGCKADSSWLGYRFEEVESTASGHLVYRIIGIVDDPVCGDKYIGNTNLNGTYVICYPTLLSGELEIAEEVLATHEISYYKEIALLEMPLKISKKRAKSDIDVDLLLKYPSLYRYTLESKSDWLALYGKSILMDLKGYKKLSARRMAYAIFTKFSKERALSINDIISLSSNQYCIDKLNSKGAILIQIHSNPTSKNKVFDEAFELLDKQFFYLSNSWSTSSKEKLEKWFVDMMYYNKIK